MNGTHEDLVNVLMVASVCLALASYVYLPVVVVKVGELLDQWAINRAAEIEREYAPAPDPQSLDATRPVDLDDCPPCEGTGLVQTRAVEDGGFIMWVTCSLCWGSGQRGAA